MPSAPTLGEPNGSASSDGSARSRTPYTVKLTGEPVSLAGIPPRQDGGLTKKTVQPRLRELTRRLHNLQEALYAANQHSVLILLQGTDTGGKGGTIEHVMGAVNPAGCQVVGFKRPTERELS